jgi:hypothetical protein
LKMQKTAFSNRRQFGVFMKTQNFKRLRALPMDYLFATLS